MRWLVIGTALLASGCKAGEGRECDSNQDCRSGLQCVQGPTKPFRCLEPGNASAFCQRQQDCALAGRCTAQDGRCIAGSDDDCRRSTADCLGLGWCKAQDGKCVASSDDDCRNSENCRLMGTCVIRADRCVAGSDDDCQKSQMCASLGKCRADDGVCRK